MHILDFIERFPGEHQCALYFKEIREHGGIECQNCGSKDHVWIESSYQFMCMQCGTIQDIKTGTLMEDSGLPFRYWFLAIYMFTLADKPYTLQEIHKKMYYMEPGQGIVMLERLQGIINSTLRKQNFDMLLAACLKKPERNSSFNFNKLPVRNNSSVEKSI